MKPEAQFEVESGEKLTAYDIYDANVVRTAWYQAVRAFFERYDYLAAAVRRRCSRSTPTTDWPKTIDGTDHGHLPPLDGGDDPGDHVELSGADVPVGFNGAACRWACRSSGQPRRARLPAARPRLRPGDAMGDEAPAAARA